MDRAQCPCAHILAETGEVDPEGFKSVLASLGLKVAEEVTQTEP